MATLYSLEISSSATLAEPFISGGPRTSIQRLELLLNALKSGNGPTAGVTLKARDVLVKASGTVTAAAVQAGDTVTINGTALTATQAYARGTVTAASVSVDDTVTVNGVVFTAKAAQDLTARQFDQSGSDTACATSLAACINAASGLSGVVTAQGAAAVVTIRSATSGTGGNALTLATSNNTRLAKSGTTLSGGAAIANNQFDFGGTDTQTAAALVTAIGASTTALISGQVTAANVAGVVTLTAVSPGTVGNALTLASSNNTRLAVSGARLTGGSETAISYSF